MAHEQESFIGPRRKYRDAANIFPALILDTLYNTIIATLRAERPPCQCAETQPPDFQWVDRLHSRECAGIWTRDLTHLSSACRYLRDALWGRGLKILEIDADEHVEKLEKIIPIHWRQAIKKVIFRPYSTEINRRGKGWTPSVARQLNTFLGSCPRLETLVARNFILHAKVDGPSLSVPHLQHLVIVTPSPVCSQALTTAFPNLQSLHVVEANYALLLDCSMETCQGSQCRKCTFSDGRYITTLFSKKLKHVTRLQLETYLPSLAESYQSSGLGNWKSWVEIRAIKALCGQFPSVSELHMAFPGPALVKSLVYDLIGMVLWLLELDSPLKRFELDVRDYSTEPMWMLAYMNGFRIDSRQMEYYKRAIQGQVPIRLTGWTPLEEFTPSVELEAGFLKNMLDIPTLEHLRILHRVGLGHTTSGPSGTSHIDAILPLYKLQCRRKQVYENGKKVATWSQEDVNYRGRYPHRGRVIEKMEQVLLSQIITDLANEHHRFGLDPPV